MIKIWGKYLSINKFRAEFILSTLFLSISLTSLTHFLESVELRKGTILNDPLLTCFNPVDVTWFTFIIIYGCLIAGIIYLAQSPIRLICGFQIYSVLVLLRISAMYLVALDPPTSLIPLVDPFAQFFTTDAVLTRDLFFSGHTATLFFLFLISENKVLKYFFLISSLTVGILVLIQHVHYTIDVFSAPFFTIGAYKLVLLIRSKFNLNYT